MCALMSKIQQNGFRKYRGFDSLLKDVCDGVYEDGEVDFANIIRQKRQSGTIAAYLKQLGVSFYFVEREYVDKDFMEDYAYYYVRCFTPYKKTCRRVHFFGAGFDVECANQKLNGRVDGKGQKGISEKLEPYLGFIVFRPLPNTVYGRVCLKALNLSNCGEEQYLAVQPIKAHLMGVALEVKAMPYQEQDTVVAACATSALWSAFQITGRKFIHCIPSPNHITNLATQGGSCTTRAFPSGGLFPDEMGRAVHKIGLAQQIIRCISPEIFKTEIYAYLRLGLPVVLIADIKVDGSDKSEGRHAVTILGYRMANMMNAASWGDLPLVGGAIDGLICHDDRIGPYVTIEDKENLWRTKIEGEAFSIVHAIVPVYHKIRIGLFDVLKELRMFNDLLSAALVHVGESVGYSSGNGFVWDAYLSTDNDIKQRAREVNKGDLSDAMLRRIVAYAMPKYVWVLSCWEDGIRRMTFLIDATGIAQDIKVFSVICEDYKVRSFLCKVAQFQELESNPFIRRIRAEFVS